MPKKKQKPQETPNHVIKLSGYGEYASFVLKRPEDIEQTKNKARKLWSFMDDPTSMMIIDGISGAVLFEHVRRK